MPPVVPPSSIAVARAVLMAALPGVPVASRAPSPYPPQFVVVDRVGGSDRWALDLPMLSIECYATDGPTAERMALDARAHLADAPGGRWGGGFVTSWQTAGLAAFPDPDQPSHERWLLTGVLSLALT